MLIGLAALLLGAEGLVRGASRLAAAAGVSALMIGLTVVAFGTSAPELAVSVMASVRGQPDIALGNVVGSNILNVLLIIGLSALVAPLAVSAQLVRLDVPVMIFASGLLAALALNGRIGRGEGILLLAVLAVYTLILIRLGRAQQSGGDKAARGHRTRQGRPWLDVVLLVGGIVLLVLGSRWLVNGAVSLASALGVSELVIGLTVVAAGTSMPELATSVVASIRGERDIAVGNVVGSNILNILGILGASSTVSGAVPVAPAVLRFDLPVLVGVAVACLPIFFTGYRIGRREGALFVLLYMAYVTDVVLVATGHAALGTFRVALLVFVVPLTAFGIGLSAWISLRSRSQG